MKRSECSIIRLAATPDRLEPGAAAAVLYLDRLCFPGDESVRPDNAWWWLARDGHRIVAFAGLSHMYTDRGFLCRAGVHPDARGQGLHRRLVRVREAMSRRLGWARLVTYTDKMNFKSSNNLARCGYRLYQPEVEWGCDGALYWYRDL